MRAKAKGFGDGQTMNQHLLVTIAEGAIAKRQLGGLCCRFHPPITLGSNRVTFVSETGNAGSLSQNGAWQSSSTGASDARPREQGRRDQLRRRRQGRLRHCREYDKGDCAADLEGCATR